MTETITFHKGKNGKPTYSVAKKKGKRKYVRSKTNVPRP